MKYGMKSSGCSVREAQECIAGASSAVRFPGGKDIQALSYRRSRSEPHVWGEVGIRQKKHTWWGEDLIS